MTPASFHLIPPKHSEFMSNVWITSPFLVILCIRAISSSFMLIRSPLRIGWNCCESQMWTCASATTPSGWSISWFLYNKADDWLWVGRGCVSDNSHRWPSRLFHLKFFQLSQREVSGPQKSVWFIVWDHEWCTYLNNYWMGCHEILYSLTTDHNYISRIKKTGFETGQSPSVQSLHVPPSPVWVLYR